MWIVQTIPIAIVLLFALIFKKSFEKISLKFLICFLSLSRMPDIITTAMYLKKVDNDYTAEINKFMRWMFLHFIPVHLPNVVILLIHSSLLILSLLLIGKLCWSKSRLHKFCVKLIILSIAIASITIAISNLALHLSE